MILTCQRITMKHVFRDLLFFVLLFCGTTVKAMNEEDVSPDDFVVSHTDHWQRISNISSINEPVCYTSQNSVDSLFRITCSSSSPITSKVSGFISSPEAWTIIDYGQIADDFVSRIRMDFSISHAFQSFSSSVNVICEPVGKTDHKKKVFVFVQDKSSSSIVTQKHVTVIDSTLIPCATTHPIPSAAPTLYQRNADGYDEKVTTNNMVYYPTQGYLSTTIFNGFYTCHQGPYNVTIYAKVSGEYIFIPAMEVVSVFSDEVIQLQCFSRSQMPLEIQIENATIKTGNLTVFPVHINHRAIVKISSQGATDTIITGTAKCGVVDLSGSRLPVNNVSVVKEWKFQFVPALNLTFHSFPNSISCESYVRLINMQIIHCSSNTECELMYRCFENSNYCKSKRPNQPYSIDSDRKYSERSSSISIEYKFYSGIAECSVKGLKKRWEFFTSLDFILYTDWRKAKMTELVRIEKEGSKNELSRFNCQAINYLFYSDNLSFKIEFINGSETTRAFDGVSCNISNPGTNILGLSTSLTLELLIPPEAVAIHCHAQWRNSTQPMIASMKLTTSDEQRDTNIVTYIVIPLVVVTVSVVVVVPLTVYLIKKYRKSRNLVKSFTDDAIDDFLRGRPALLSTLTENEMETVDFVPYDTKFEIPLDDLEFDTKGGSFLGRGHFSYVVRGKLLSKALPVAIKVSLPSEDVTLFKSILSEVKIMIHTGKHENIVELIGVCTEGIRNRSIYIITEICELGSLNKFLRKARPDFINLMNASQELDRSLLPIMLAAQRTADILTTLDLINFAGQIAKGMEFVSSKSIIHADLAARNVLLTSQKIVKISDFGLSKNLYQYSQYVKKSKTPVPWRWLAIETLKTLTFSTASDVWAYGVTLFEIFTLGDSPFPMEEWNKEFCDRLEWGMRLECPKYCTPEIYSKMMACWEKDSSDRPAFGDLRLFFDEVSNKYKEGRDGSLNNFTDGSPQYTNVEESHTVEGSTEQFPMYLELVEM